MPYIPIVKIVLAPVLLLQGRRARKSALRLPEAEGPRHGCIPYPDCADPLDLLFLGDSTMAGVGVNSQTEALGFLTATEVSLRLRRSVRWQVIAKSGLIVSQAAMLLEHRELRADVLITALGGNDVLGQTSPHDFIEAYKTLIATVRSQNPACLAVVSGLPPLHITPAIPHPLRWFFGVCAKRLDRRLRRYLRKRLRASFVSLQWAADKTRLAADRFHPGDGLYREWSQRLALGIARDLEQAGSGASNPLVPCPLSF